MQQLLWVTVSSVECCECEHYTRFALHTPRNKNRMIWNPIMIFGTHFIYTVCFNVNTPALIQGSVFICFILMSEREGNVTMYRIKQSVLTVRMQHVSCELGTVSVNTSVKKFVLQRFKRWICWRALATETLSTLFSAELSGMVNSLSLPEWKMVR
jgi:hypothetical protein